MKKISGDNDYHARVFFDENKSKYALIQHRTSNRNGIPTKRYIVCFLLNFDTEKSLFENAVKDFRYINFIYVPILTPICLNVIFVRKYQYNSAFSFDVI